MSSSSHFVTAHVGSKFLAMTLFPTLCTGGRVRWRHNQIFWHQVAVRWPSRDSRRSSQSEFLKIRVDLYTSLQQVLCCACCDLGSRPAKMLKIKLKVFNIFPVFEVDVVSNICTNTIALYWFSVPKNCSITRHRHEVRVFLQVPESFVFLVTWD